MSDRRFLRGEGDAGGDASSCFGSAIPQFGQNCISSRIGSLQEGQILAFSVKIHVTFVGYQLRVHDRPRRRILTMITSPIPITKNGAIHCSNDSPINEEIPARTIRSPRIRANNAAPRRSPKHSLSQSRSPPKQSLLSEAFSCDLKYNAAPQDTQYSESSGF
jgi:hypothetical protein